jgi:PAS domain-containing protein
LEMQNEELRGAQVHLETALERYTELYDFAPAGYLTLQPDGTIQQANLAAATMLGIERSRLLRRCFGGVCRSRRPCRLSCPFGQGL